MSKDAHIDPVMDLSRETLLKACKGDPSKLPAFIVHDDDAWPWFNQVRPAKGNLHIRRSTFNRVVAPQVPVVAGMFTGPSTQLFTIALKAEHLQGSSDEVLRQPGGKNHEAARMIAVADQAGRLPDEEDYRAPDMGRPKSGKIDPDDLERVAADGGRGSVRSTAFDGLHDTERNLSVGNDD